MLDLIQADLKAAMLAKDAPRTQVLRMVVAAFRNEAIAKGLGPQGTLEEGEALAVLRKLVKSREDSVEQFTRGGRQDLADKESAEIQILKAYLPSLLEGAELLSVVQQAITAAGATSKRDMGLVMKHLQAHFSGRYDGKVVSQLIPTLLP